MKKTEQTASGKNFTAVTVGKMSELGEHVLRIAPNFEIAGKVFVGQALQATGAEMSFQRFEVGAETGFLHTHKTHEELYIIIGGKGEFQVDGQIFEVSEGSVIRVAPNGRRSLRNTGHEALTMICVQYKVATFDASDASDGEILHEQVEWK